MNDSVYDKYGKYIGKLTKGNIILELTMNRLEMRDFGLLDTMYGQELSEQPVTSVTNLVLIVQLRTGRPW